MRDYRINLIFEGSSEIMRLFIAREAVDTHMKVAGALIDPKAPLGKKSGAAPPGAFYATWYPKLWLGWGWCPATASSASWRTHVRFVSRASRRLARTLFHCMIRFGPKLEKRQMVLGRLVEIGAELLAITAACSRAHAMAKQDREPAGRAGRSLLPARPAPGGGERFAEVFDNDDVETYAVAQGVIQNEYTWLETGMVAETEGEDRPRNSSGARDGPARREEGVTKTVPLLLLHFLPPSPYGRTARSFRTSSTSDGRWRLQKAEPFLRPGGHRCQRPGDVRVRRAGAADRDRDRRVQRGLPL